MRKPPQRKPTLVRFDSEPFVGGSIVEYRELDRLTALDEVKAFVGRVMRGDGLDFGFTSAPVEFAVETVPARASDRRERG